MHLHKSTPLPLDKNHSPLLLHRYFAAHAFSWLLHPFMGPLSSTMWGRFYTRRNELHSRYLLLCGLHRATTLPLPLIINSTIVAVSDDLHTLVTFEPIPLTLTRLSAHRCMLYIALPFHILWTHRDLRPSPIPTAPFVFRSWYMLTTTILHCLIPACVPSLLPHKIPLLLSNAYSLG